jgi:hypothetical protein
MSKDLAIEALNQRSHNSPLDASGDSYYVAIQPDENIIDALRWIMAVHVRRWRFRILND